MPRPAQAVLPAPPIELRTTVVNDVCLALAGLPLGLLGLWCALIDVWSPDFAADMEGGSGPLAVAWEVAGPAPLAIGFGLFGFWLVCTGVGGVWRLVDRRPAISADQDGLRFHPSVCPRPVGWDEVRAMKVGTFSTRSTQVRIDLSRRLWSPLVWAGGRSIRLYAQGLGLSVREARDVVREMKALSPARRLKRSTTPAA